MIWETCKTIHNCTFDKHDTSVLTLLQTLYAADGHKLGALQLRRAAILVLLHGLWDQFSTMFLHMGCHLFCHVSYHCTQSIDCKYNLTVKAQI